MVEAYHHNFPEKHFPFLAAAIPWEVEAGVGGKRVEMVVTVG
jgi:hypothetical protein